MESLPLSEAIKRDFPRVAPDQIKVEYHIGLALDTYITIEVDRTINAISNIGVRQYDMKTGKADKHFLTLDGIGSASSLYKDICAALLYVAEDPKLDKIINVNVWKSKSDYEVVTAYTDAKLCATVQRVVQGLTALKKEKH